MKQGFERRIAALEATASGDAVGIVYEGDDQSDGLVRAWVNGRETLLSPEEFRYDYPNGRIVRIHYIENWRE